MLSEELVSLALVGLGDKNAARIVSKLMQFLTVLVTIAAAQFIVAF